MQIVLRIAAALEYRARASWFFALNRFRFKRLEFGSMVRKPLRMDGRRFISLGRHVIVQNQSWLFAAQIDEHEPNLFIDDGCVIGNFNHIASVRSVVFGKYVLTADRVYVSDNVHEFEDVNTPIMNQPVRFKSAASIGDGSWIGENVSIIGARIGKHCVIGANSVVTRDIPDFSVAVGAPATVIKRFNPTSNRWERV
jgi:acetyltransferase-like isoleucine patch superfamily enzyme